MIFTHSVVNIHIHTFDSYSIHIHTPVVNNEGFIHGVNMSGETIFPIKSASLIHCVN